MEQLVAEETSASSDDVSFDNLCAFSRSSSIASGYSEWSININGTDELDTDELSVIVRNPGESKIPQDGPSGIWV